MMATVRTDGGGGASPGRDDPRSAGNWASVSRCEALGAPRRHVSGPTAARESERSSTRDRGVYEPLPPVSRCTRDTRPGDFAGSVPVEWVSSRLMGYVMVAPVRVEAPLVTRDSSWSYPRRD